MATIIGISGSLRRDSLNTMLLRAAVDLPPKGTTIEVASIRGIPLYDGDVEAESGLPQHVVDLKEKIAAADGLLLVTPEYNNSIPGVLKNAIDWLSRPPADIGRVFGRKPVGVIGATPGQGGTILAQAALLPVLKTLGTLAWSGAKVTIAGAGRAFDEEGRLKDDAIRVQLSRYITGFSQFVEQARGLRSSP